MFNLKNLINTWDRIMVAITFAEAGERASPLKKTAPFLPI